MRWLTLVLVVLIVAIQYPLWLGKGGWLRVWEVDRQITAQKEVNKKLGARNTSLDAEVKDLKQGYEAIEERARNELGMVKQDEVFFQVLDNTPKPEPRAQANRPADAAAMSAEKPAAKAVAPTPKPSTKP
jgi:cell division protein FtsB